MGDLTGAWDSSTSEAMSLSGSEAIPYANFTEPQNHSLSGLLLIPRSCAFNVDYFEFFKIVTAETGWVRQQGQQ